MSLDELRAAAEARPPDRVTYTMWEDDPDSAYQVMVASKFSLLTVLEYVEVTRYGRQRRKRTEWWDVPETHRPVVTGLDDLTVTIERTAPATLARWEWEYRAALDRLG